MTLLDKVALGFSGVWLFVAALVYVISYIRKIGNGRVFRDFWIAWSSVPALPVIAMIILQGRFYRAHAAPLLLLYFTWAAFICWLCRTNLWVLLVTSREKGEDTEADGQ